MDGMYKVTLTTSTMRQTLYAIASSPREAGEIALGRVACDTPKRPWEILATNYLGSEYRCFKVEDGALVIA